MATFLSTPVPNLEASDFIKSKPAVSRKVFDQLLPELKARAFCISGIEAADVLQRARDLVAELPQGGDWQEIKGKLLDEITPYFVDEAAPAEDQEKQRTAADRRAELLLRTHGQQAYAAAQHGMLEEQKELFPFWQYITLGDSHVRPTHAALDHIVLPANHEFWQSHYPPWDWGCRCQIVPLTRHETARMDDADKNKPPDNQRVLSEYAQQDLTTNRRLVRNGVTYNMRSKREEGQPGAYAFHPGDLRITPDQLKARYDADIFKQFQDWAEKQKLDDVAKYDGSIATVWEWMNGILPSTPPGPPPSPTPTPPPAPPKPAPPVPPASPLPPPKFPTPAPKPTPGPKPGTPVTAPASRPGALPKTVPSGTPVSSAAQIAPSVVAHQAKEYQKTLDLIDGLHGDGALAPIPFDHHVDTNASGTYWSNRYHAASIGVEKSLVAGDVKFSLAHEIGHWIDHVGVTTAHSAYKFASANPHTALKEVMDAIRASDAFAKVTARPPSGYRTYLLEHCELFARAYAQWVAEETKDFDMHSQLSNIRSGQTAYWPESQWKEADFKPIQTAFRSAFSKLGWIQ